jgi:hypothetical protein
MRRVAMRRNVGLHSFEVAIYLEEDIVWLSCQSRPHPRAGLRDRLWCCYNLPQLLRFGRFISSKMIV